MMRYAGVVLAVCAMVLTQGEAVQGQESRTHQGFWISFGLGGGWNLTRNLGLAQTSEAGVAFDLRLGGTPSEKLLVGGEVIGWARTEGDLTVSRGNTNFTVMYYPSVQSGVYLKAGVGVATFMTSLSFLNTTTTTSNSGFGSTAGIGWDVKLGKNFYLTPGLDFLYQRVEDTDNTILLITLSATWH